VEKSKKGQDKDREASQAGKIKKKGTKREGPGSFTHNKIADLIKKGFWALAETLDGEK